MYTYYVQYIWWQSLYVWFAIFQVNISLVVCWLWWGHWAPSEHHFHCQSSGLSPHSTSWQYPSFRPRQRTIRINKSSGLFLWKVYIKLSTFVSPSLTRGVFPISPVLMEPASVSVFIATSQSNQFPRSFYKNIYFQWISITRPECCIAL